MEEILFSDIESRRFDMAIHRGKLNEANIQELKKYILQNNVDTLILRLPSTSKANYSRLANIGFDVIHADSLVYYSLGLSEHQVSPMRNMLRFELIDESNNYMLDEIIPLIFEGYQNHYFSNPFFDRSEILDGYVEWAKGYSKGYENRISWYVFKENNLVGFATCSFNNDKKECEGVLYGVIPLYSGIGIYSDIIRFTQKYFKDLGFKKMLVSTQIQNYSVQKVWIREGFFLFNSFETYHINSLLNFSIKEKKSFKFTVSEKILNEFATFSGDMNRLHFDPEFAKGLGFEDRIAHGLISLSFLSKIFGVDYPGEGTLFLTNKNMFLSPVYLNREYTISLSTLSQNEKGLTQILAKVIDENKNICLLSYNNLIKR